MKRRSSLSTESSWLKVIGVDFRRNKSLYAFMIPVLAFYFIFHYMPMYGALMAFTDYTPTLGIFGSRWVGFKHFADFFSSPSFAAVFGNTLKISLSTLIFNFPAPIILALLLNEVKNQRFSKIVQNMAYLPHFISLVVVCGLVKTFTKDSGIVTQLLGFFGVPQASLLEYPKYFTPIYVATTVWQETGWNSIIYLAALMGVDAALYEAARIDGANKWKQICHITLPSILPTIVTMLILNMGSIFNVGHEKILLLYNDATLEVADVISTYVYRKGLLEQNWGFSAAVNIFNSVINLVLLLFTNAISRKLNDTSLW